MREFINGDCMDYLKDYPRNFFDLAIVDPPYRDENQPTKDMRKNGFIRSKWSGGKPTPEYFEELFRVSKNQIIWGANNFTLPNYKGFVVWEKHIPENFTMSMAEIAYISEGLGTISKIVRFPSNTGGGRIHPTQKPIDLYKWLLSKYAKPGDLILDTHVGSASSLIACEDMGFNYVGFEIDPEYFKLAKGRLDEFNAQIRFF